MVLMTSILSPAPLLSKAKRFHFRFPESLHSNCDLSFLSSLLMVERESKEMKTLLGNDSSQ